MTAEEARDVVAELQAQRGVKPKPPQPVASAEQLLDIVMRDDVDRFEDAARYLEGKGGVDAITMSATVELLWSDAFGTVALVARELGRRAEVEVSRLQTKQDSGREFTSDDKHRLEQANGRVEVNAKAEMALGVLSREHLASGSEIAREALRQFPDDERTYRVAAFYYLSTGTWGRYDDCMAFFKDVEQDDAGLLYLRALEALRRRSASDEARGWLKRALGINPRLVRAQAKLVLIQDDIGASYAELTRLEAVAPGHPVVRITGPLIKSEYELSQSFERARGSTGP
jgi:tetratricopeptide (TPR) repeat protein